MRTIKQLAILPVIAIMAACGPEESKPMAVDSRFLEELELAITPVTETPVISPLELGVNQLGEAEPVAVAAQPTPPARQAPAARAPARQASSTANAPARAPVARVETVKHTKRDAAIGAGAGAAIGAAVAGSGSRVKGAAVGAIVGGVAGAVIGNNVDKSTRVVYE